jgi:hypothetical protein
MAQGTVSSASVWEYAEYEPSEVTFVGGFGWLLFYRQSTQHTSRVGPPDRDGANFAITEF